MAEETPIHIEHMPFHSRELSWLDFLARVLDQAGRRDFPLLERLNYLIITRDNLDEFFMVRVAGLIRRKDRGHHGPGLPPARELKLVLERVADLYDRHAAMLAGVLAELEGHGVSVLGGDGLDARQGEFARRYFFDRILPVLTPLAVDPARPVPRLGGRALCLGVRLADGERSRFGLVQIPPPLPGLLPLPAEHGMCFLPVTDLIRRHVGELFGLYPVAASGFFRLTRGADLDPEEDTDCLLTEMERTLDRRKAGPPVRLELERGMDGELAEFLTGALTPEPCPVFYPDGPLDMAGCRAIRDLGGLGHLRFPPSGGLPAMDFAGERDLFSAIRARDRLVHFPYESFQIVEDFLSRAAEDGQVLAIKQTLYRVEERSPVIAALERAAELGKSVTVLVELKARFDEAKNIRWAERLERAGCHVIYGLPGLKTHCKLTMAVRQEGDGLRRYLYLGTGNFNGKTARGYTDLGLFTCDPALGEDVAALFNRLTGYAPEPPCHKLVTSPGSLRDFFLRAIETERKNHLAGKPAGLLFKVNSLLDAEVIAALYRAGRDRLPVRLLVRGICGLVPGVEGLSETVEVRSLVGRFLEHSRVFVLENGGEPLVYLGSADLMPRNLDRRVEAIFPVEDPGIRRRLRAELDLMWRDTVNGRRTGPDGGSYRIPGPPLDAQAALLRGERLDGPGRLG